MSNQAASAVFQVDLDPGAIANVSRVDGGSSAAIDWSQPWVMCNPDSLKLCIADGAVQKALSAWGAQYSKLCNSQGTPVVTHPLPEKQGREEVHNFIMDLVPKEDIVNLKDVAGGDSFMNAAWLYGCAPDMKHLATLPNHAPIFKILACGRIRTFLVELASLREGIRSIQQKPELLPLKETLEFLRDADAPTVEALRAQKVVMCQIIQDKNEILFVPAGWIVVESANAKPGELIFGCRKSVFMKRYAKQYEDAISLTTTGTDRMKQILAIMKAPSTADDGNGAKP